MFKLINTALDPMRAMQRRTAPRMQMEPTFAGRRLRLRQEMLISDSLFELNRKFFEEQKAHGVLDYEQVSVDDPSVVFNVEGIKKAPLEFSAPPSAVEVVVEEVTPSSEEMELEVIEPESAVVLPEVEEAPKASQPAPREEGRGKKRR